MITHTHPAPPRLIGEQEARALARAALAEAGLPDRDARQVADALVDTSLRGIDTHGLRLLPQSRRISQAANRYGAWDGTDCVVEPRWIAQSSRRNTANRHHALWRIRSHIPSPRKC